jgi:glycosyltransferase involved in cell wall biosynthesis
LKKRRVGRKLRDLTGFDAIYLNSATSALALRVLPEVPPLIISHIHELDSAFAHWFDELDRAEMIARTDWFVACADTVGRMLTEYGVDPTRISCHHEFIEPPGSGSDGSGGLRSIVDIPEGAFIVGASGQAIWRKGPDLFIQMAAHIVSRQPDLDVHFVWVGAMETDLWALHDVDKMGLRGRVHFVGQIEEPNPLYADFDVFCLTSREDPFPLVMLEVAALGVPVVGFDNGGIVEFAGADGCCIVVDYLDVAALGTAVTDLLASPARRSALGETARERVRTQHVVDVAAPRLYRDMMEHLAVGPGRRGAE